MAARGWDSVDFVYVIGDAYVDHPSFGPAIISRVLESKGYRVGIIAQPDWTNGAGYIAAWLAKSWLSGKRGQYGFNGKSLFGCQKA